MASDTCTALQHENEEFCKLHWTPRCSYCFDTMYGNYYHSFPIPEDLLFRKLLHNTQIGFPNKVTGCCELCLTTQAQGACNNLFIYSFCIQMDHAIPTRAIIEVSVTKLGISQEITSACVMKDSGEPIVKPVSAILKLVEEKHAALHIVSTCVSPIAFMWFLVPICQPRAPFCSVLMVQGALPSMSNRTTFVPVTSHGQATTATNVSTSSQLQIQLNLTEVYSTLPNFLPSSN